MEHPPGLRPLPVRRRTPHLIAPLLLLGLAALIALGALLDWPRSEPAARRMLALRAAELDGWLRQELVPPVERIAFAESGGAADGAAAWREVVRALESHAAGAPATRRGLPPFDAGGAVGTSVATAIGARRFTPFEAIDALATSEWLRAARLLAALIERTPATHEPPIDAWLDAAVVFAADLRGTALLAPAIGAAELEEAVERRLAARTDGADVEALRALVVHAIAAESAIPSPERVAERESRLAQACVCARARIAPFDRFSAAEERGEDEAPWPVVMAAQAVDRLESYDERLREVLVAAPGDRARAAYQAWVAAFARELPAAAPLVVDPALLAPVRGAPARLQRIRAAAQRRLDAADG